MTPNWHKAPSWATHAAMDCNGAWWWYDKEPALDEPLGMFTAGSGRALAVTHPGWQESVHGRPGTCGVVLTSLGRLVGGCVFTLESYYAAGWTDELLVEHELARWGK